MNKHYLKLAFSLLTLLGVHTAQAGNDTKRGQGGAGELLVNPWARSSGWANSNVSSVTGLESSFINVAGLSSVVGTEVAMANVRYLSGSDINIFSLGLATRLSEFGVLGFSFTNWGLGQLVQTTYDLPEGAGVFNLSLSNFSVSYTQQFSEKISAGILLRGVFHSIPNMGGTGVAADAGIQYRTGDKKEFHIGVTLRNIGTKIRYQGDGLSTNSVIQDPDRQYDGTTMSQIINGFEMPVLLGIGTGYDFHVDGSNRITVSGTFQSNTYTQDNYLFGAEYGFKDLFMARVGYNLQNNIYAPMGTRTDVNRGLTAGLSVNVPLEEVFRSGNGGELTEESAPVTPKNKRTFSFDYSFRQTNPYNGTHSLGMSVAF